MAAQTNIPISLINSDIAVLTHEFDALMNSNVLVSQLVGEYCLSKLKFSQITL